MEKLLEYHWPGNVRELENMLTRAMVLAKGEVLSIDLFHMPVEGEAGQKPLDLLKTVSAMSLAEVEKEHIEKVLDAQKWNKKRTIEILGVSRPTLDKKIREYNIKRKSE